MAVGTSGPTLRIERRLAAARERVFGALLAPDELRRWWGPRGFDARVLELEPRKGGGYRIEMTPPHGPMFHLRGTFLDVAGPGRLEYTFRWEEPDPDDRETRVLVSLDAHGSTTLLTVTQGPFLTDARRDLHLRGWSESLDRLAKLLIRR